MKKAFISYSHADEAFLKDLKICLSQLRRSGALQEWSDQEITAGTDLTQEITNQLESSNLFIALLSPDYIASKYCFENEFQKALELKAIGQQIIVPIICRPCDWKQTEFKNFLATPKDGKPISQWDNKDTAFFNVTEMLRQLLNNGSDAELTTVRASNQANTPNRRYVVQKDFDKIQKVEFLEVSFDLIVDNLKNYLDEISSLENVKFKILHDQPSKFSCILVNRDKGIAEAELTFKKSNEPNNRFYNGFENGDLNVQIQSGNNETKLAFVLAANEVEQFFEKRAFMNTPKKQQHSAVEIGYEIWRNWLHSIGVTME